MPYAGVWRSVAAWLRPSRRAAATADLAELETLRRLLDAAPVAIVSLTKEGSVAVWNHAAERLFGWRHAEVAGGPPPYVTAEASAAEAALRQRVLAGNELFRRRCRCQQRVGEVLELLVSSVPQRTASGDIIGVVSVFEEAIVATPPTAPRPVEIAERAPPQRPGASPRMRPQLAADSRQSDQPASAAPLSPGDQATRAEHGNDGLGLERPAQFLARVSHDLRQPLHALSLLTGALERRVKEPDSRELVQNAGQMIRALQDTFDNVVDLARLEEGQVLPSPVMAPAREMMAPVVADIARNARKRGIDFRYVPSGAMLRADPILLQRLLRQLLGNALRFAQHADGTGGKVLLGVRRSGDRLRIMVADDGIGIPADQAEAVFGPFVQLEAGRASGGLGLGLAIAQKLARLLQSQIAMRSEPGKGSVFWVDLPSAANPDPAARSTAG